MLYFVVSSLVISMLCGRVHSETYQQHLQQNLGTAFEFKIHIDAAKEDCYYQWIEPGASFYASFHVSVYAFFFYRPISSYSLLSFKGITRRGHKRRLLHSRPKGHDGDAL